MKWFFQKQRNLIFEITQKCNQDCFFCYNVWKGSSGYPKGELSLQRIKILLKKIIKETKCKLLTLSGGEPCLRNDLTEIISFISSQKVSINLITNGSLLLEEIIKDCINKVSVFELQLLGPRDVHNYLTRANLFDKTMEAIANIKYYGGRVVSVFVGTKFNLPYFKETIELAVALGVNGMMFNRFNPGGEGRKYINDLLPTPEEIKTALEIADSAVKEYGLSISCSIPIQPCLIDISQYKNLRFGFCSVGSKNSYYTIDSLGNLRICNHSMQILGNLFEKSFFELNRNKKIDEFLKTIPDYCKRCQRAKECQGGCKASAEVVYQNIYEEEPFLKLGINPNRVISC